jgi:hypothetical protein
LHYQQARVDRNRDRMTSPRFESPERSGDSASRVPHIPVTHSHLAHILTSSPVWRLPGQELSERAHAARSRLVEAKIGCNVVWVSPRCLRVPTPAKSRRPEACSGSTFTRVGMQWLGPERGRNAAQALSEVGRPSGTRLAQTPAHERRADIDA